MENVNIVLAANILKYRKKNGLSQDELAQKLGVTFQAVSKWENAKAAPDITFLPIMADIFGCYIDELFSREVKTEIHYDHCPEFPWPDDTVIRGVICKGKKILKVTESPADKISFEILGNSLSVSSESHIIINGNVVGGCVSRGGSISVNGSITGECTAGGDIKAGEWIMGECTANGNIHAGASITGECTAEHITATDIFGDVCGEFQGKCE